MASLDDATVTELTGEKKSFFRLLRQHFAKRRVVLGRNCIATMLFFLLIINEWQSQNMRYNIKYGHSKYQAFSAKIVNWNTTDRRNVFSYVAGVNICFQVPGALLIYIISSYKFMTAAVAISSTLHILTPLVTSCNCLVFILLTQELVKAPLRIAILSMWKDWAPPTQRTKFVFISFICGILAIPFSYITIILYDIYLDKKSFYIIGGCGLGWSLLWFVTVSDRPAYDTQIPQNDQLCQRTDPLKTVKRQSKLSEVPWKNILTSIPIYALCLIYLKIGGSFGILNTMAYFFSDKINTRYNIYRFHFHLPFALVFAVVLISSAIMTDDMCRKFPRRTKLIKGILCIALIIHAVILFGILINNLFFQVPCFCISYFVFSTCIAGFYTNALDLSSEFVSIIGGFIETFYQLGQHLAYIYIEPYDMFSSETFHEDTYPFGGILYYEIFFTIAAAVVFQIWGSLEEQPWSLKFSLSLRPETDPVHSLEEHELREVGHNT